MTIHDLYAIYLLAYVEGARVLGGMSPGREVPA